MAGKKTKSKKPAPSANYTPSIAPSAEEQEDLMDNLFAELDARDQPEPASVLREINDDKARETSESAPKKQDSKSRHLARQARKATALAQSVAPSNPEADAQLEREIKQEMMSIKRICDELGVHIHEINPDGHCLFSAIADQLAVLNILPASLANYATVRVAASDYIYQHSDDFLPFLTSSSGEDGVGATGDTGLLSAEQFEQYCLNIGNTGAWGGEPEILALSRAYNVPIQVVQGGNPPVVVHSPDGNSSVVLDRSAKVVRISFHRRMYGLGEHYNSLRPKNALTTVTDKIQSMLS
ncbi:OTU-domain-containing protein [Phlebopus sp. FC_14]|nr:OTU-domain-containing protein [Phlebopus sp. FC_14]